MQYAICGLEYVYLENAPMRQTRYGPVLDADVALVEQMIAKEIVLQRIPIRGAEVQFLRKALGVSMQEFGRMLGLSAPAILKWERARERRLQPTNEVAVRALMAEQLHVAMEGKFTILKGNDDPPERISIRVA